MFVVSREIRRNGGKYGYQPVWRLMRNIPETPDPDQKARKIDAVIMGRRTYQPALDMGLSDGAYPHVTQYVVSHQPLPASSSVRWVDRDPAGFIADLKRQPGKDIWLCGGGELAAQLYDAIDVIQIKINPILLGEGIPLVRGTPAPLTFELVESEQLPGGILLTTYRRPSI